jgi:arylsulfatase A-like enzyme
MQIFLFAVGSWLTFLFVDFLFFLFSTGRDAKYFTFMPTPDTFTILLIILCYAGIGIFTGFCLKCLEVLDSLFLFVKKNKWVYLTITLCLGLNCLMNIVLFYKNSIGVVSFPAAVYFIAALILFATIIACVLLIIKFSVGVQKGPVIALISVCTAGEVLLSIMREGLFAGGCLKGTFIGGNSISVIVAAFFISGFIFAGIYFGLPRFFTIKGKRGLNFFLCLFAGSLLVASTGVMSHAGQPAATLKKPNIVLIILDTVRADHLSCYGYAGKKTPNIDSFASQAVKYNHAYATASWTLPSVASILTGMYPPGHGADRLKETDNPATQIKGLDNKHATLAALLKEAGYATAAVISCAFLTNNFGLHQGFDYFDENISSATTIMQTCAAVSFLNIFFPINDLLTSKGHNDRRIGGQVNASAIDWLNQHDSTKPFFLMLHYFDAHHPYFPEKLGVQSIPYSIRNRYAKSANYADVEKQLIDTVMQGKKELLQDEKQFLIENYDNQIVALDVKIGQIVSHLKEMKLYDESLIIIAADHGESFGEHNLMLHGICLYEDNLHVPLLIKYPLADQKRGAIDYPVSLTGLVPTVLSYLSISTPLFVQGVPFSSEKNQVIFANNVNSPFSAWLLPEPLNADTFSLLQDGHKLIKFSKGHDQLYYLNEDPNETVNIIAKEGATSSKLQENLKIYIGKYSDRRFTKKDIPKVDKATLESLRNLGYIQ